MTSPAHPMHSEISLDTGHATSGLIAHRTPGARVGQARVEVGENTHIIAIRPLGNSALEVEAEAEDQRPELLIEIDLGAAVAYWHPGRRSPVALPADWLPSTFTSLVHSAPLGALYDDAGRVVLGWAADQAVVELEIQAGVSEERKGFLVRVRPAAPLLGRLTLRVDVGGQPLAPTVNELTQWISARCEGVALDAAPSARKPVYSTWYAFAQNLDAQTLTSETAAAIELGCGSVFIDDGWQLHGHGRGYAGCGDWLPDEAKFDDLTSTIATIRSRGASVALWVAPLLLGARSAAFAALRQFAPYRHEDLQCHVLDPRRREVRQHVADTCLRLVADYGLDMLKIDFLDQAMVYRDQPDEGDIPSIGHAMISMLSQLREQLDAAGHGHVAFEFRQPYVSPAIARYGQILRAHDCPGDSLTNRATIVDARLVSAGQIVHSDPMMWGQHALPHDIARQFYAGWFSVPQISMRLDQLTHTQTATLRDLIASWCAESTITLDGELSLTGVERGCDTIHATHVGLNRSVIVAYSPVTIELDASGPAETTIHNATGSPRLTIRSSRPIRGGTIRSLDGAQLQPIEPHPGGLVELQVPTFCVATLQADDRILGSRR